MSRTEIEDRRQRAREAANDVNLDPYEVDRFALKAAIDVATQVKITPDVVERLAHCWDGDFGTRGTIEAAIVQDVCAALGFEIVE